MKTGWLLEGTSGSILVGVNSLYTVIYWFSSAHIYIYIYSYIQCIYIYILCMVSPPPMIYLHFSSLKQCKNTCVLNRLLLPHIVFDGWPESAQPKYMQIQERHAKAHHKQLEVFNVVFSSVRRTFENTGVFFPAENTCEVLFVVCALHRFQTQTI